MITKYVVNYQAINDLAFHPWPKDKGVLDIFSLNSMQLLVIPHYWHSFTDLLEIGRPKNSHCFVAVRVKYLDCLALMTHHNSFHKLGKFGDRLYL